MNLNAARLQKLGYQVEKETDLERALKTIKAAPNPVDLIFTDITMPKMNGQTLCREILKIRPDMKILTCTGYKKEMISDPALQLSAIECMEKPFDMKTLAVKVMQTPDT